MTELKKLLSIYLDLYLHQIIISGARTKEGASKIRIRPVIMKDKLYFQCTSTVGTKEIHENYEKEPLLEHIEGWITGDFRQLQLESELGSVNVLSSKKGKLTIKEKKKKKEGNLCDKPIRMEALSHNRKKRYILEEGKPVEHELNRQIHNEVLAPVFSYGVLKERIAALMTDGLRAQMLEQAGYDTQILEFIDMEHTPKNLLIRAVYTGKKKENKEQLRACLDAFGLHPTLERLLKEGGREA